MRSANHAIVFGSSSTKSRPPRKKVSTSSPFPGFASIRTNNPFLITSILLGAEGQSGPGLADQFSYASYMVYSGSPLSICIANCLFANDVRLPEDNQHAKHF